jgi:hypothetical protein
MVAINFNAHNIKPNEGRDPVPSGNYPVVIEDTIEKPNSKGTGSYLEIKMRIIEGQYNGRFVYDRLNLKNPNQQTVDIAQSTLSAICWCTGRMQINDTRDLHNVPLQAIVIKRKRSDMPDVDTNEVRGYKDARGNDPGGLAGNVAQPQAQPAWAQQQYTPTPAPAQPAPYQPPQQAPYPHVETPPPVTYPQATQAPAQPQQWQQPPQAPAQPYPPQPAPNGAPPQQPAPQAPAPAPVPAATPYPTQASGPPPWVQQ